MTGADELARFACGAFFLVGLVTGVWKYRGMATSAEAVAPVYVDIAHRASLMYAFRLNRWWAVLGLLAHGLQDTLHSHLWENAGVPSWWTGFCLAIDVTLAALAAWAILSAPGGKDRLVIGVCTRSGLRHHSVLVADGWPWGQKTTTGKGLDDRKP